MKRRSVRSVMMALVAGAVLALPIVALQGTSLAAKGAAAAPTCDPGTGQVEGCLPETSVTLLPSCDPDPIEGCLPETTITPIPSGLPPVPPPPPVPPVPNPPPLTVPASGCVRAGFPGAACQFALSGNRILIAGAQLPDPSIVPTPPPAPTPPPPPTLAPEPRPNGIGAKARARGFVVDLIRVNPSTGETAVLASCTGNAFCVHGTEVSGIAEGTILTCVLRSADTASGFGCASYTTNPPPPPAPPTLPPAPTVPPAPNPTPPTTPPLPPHSVGDPASYAGHGCVAVDGVECQVLAADEASNTTLEGTTIVGGRVSWIAAGTWTIEMYFADDCSGSPYRTYSSATDNNLPGGMAGSNNGGGFYGSCVKATATGPGSFVLMGAMHTDHLP